MLKRLLALIVLACTLSSCTTMMTDEAFTAAPPEQRVLNSPNVDWVATNDATLICEALGKHSAKGAMLKTEHGCAIWSKSSNRCTIFTLRDTYHSVLGHEARHCFEGHFHSPPPTGPPICK